MKVKVKIACMKVERLIRSIQVTGDSQEMTPYRFRLRLDKSRAYAAEHPGSQWADLCVNFEGMADLLETIREAFA